MSMFTGRQYKGAMAAYRAAKREEAERRNRTARAERRLCGHVHGWNQAMRCPQWQRADS